MKKIKIMLWSCLYSGLLLASSAGHISYNQAVDANMNLNVMVDALRNNPEQFSNAEINQYVQDFEIFEKYVAQLKKEGKLNDAAYYEQYFVVPYKEFYDKIVKHAQKNPTALQAELHRLEDQTEKIQNMLDQVGQGITAAFDQFTSSMKGKIGSLSEYNESKKEEFFRSLNGSVKTFESQMTSLELDVHNKFLGRAENINPDMLTPSQIRLLQGVRRLTQDALLQVHALALDLTAEHLNLDFSSQTAAALARYEQEAEDNYKRSLEENKSGADKPWFDEVKAKGSRFIDGFKKEFKKQASAKLEELKQDATKKLKERAEATAKKFGGELLDTVKKKLV